ncbi:site-specific integrase [Leptolyngbya ohadii]|uniref:site-specific integrase n=1 Tax=Leptolyngbya ohadii TaxID=1962290 RepID=UPI001179FAFC|nr:site-specific integrase [Leptolyngbya ohadii]
MTEKRRSKKGSVVVESHKGWLRLRWSWSGKRYTLTLGLPDDNTNRAIAQRKAEIIQADIRLDQFDETLAKYRSQPTQAERLTAVALFEQFIEHKRRQVDPVTLAKYVGLVGYLKQFFRNQFADLITEDQAFQFRDRLLKSIQPVTAAERLGLLRACWIWGQKRRLVQVNPWLDVKIKVPPKQRPRPFSKTECEKILDGFKNDPVYSYYSDFAEFLLSLGCRIGEAAGLKWGHLAEDCSAIWVGETWSRGRQKTTKTNRSRAFKLSPRIQQMLLERKLEGVELTAYVFPAPRGGAIDDHNFRNRAWKPILKRVGVEYRMPRNSRHSFISQAIAAGHNPAEVAEIVGNSPKTLMQNYLGVAGKAQLPELWD